MSLAFRLKHPLLEMYGRWIALGVLFSMVWLFRVTVAWQGFAAWDSSDECDYAQLARNVSRGWGVVTSCSRPFELCIFPSIPHPELTRGPGLPILLGMSLKLFGEREMSLLLPIGGLYVLTVLLVGHLTQRLTDSFLAGLCASFLYGFSHLALLYSSSVGVEIAQAFFVISAVRVCLVCKPSNTSFLWQGFFLGCGTWFRFSVVLLAPGLFCMGGVRWEGRKTLRRGMMLCLGLLGSVLPLLGHNLKNTGYIFSPVYRYSCMATPGALEGYAVWCRLSLPKERPSFLERLPTNGWRGIQTAAYSFRTLCVTRSWTDIASTTDPNRNGWARAQGLLWCLCLLTGSVWIAIKRPGFGVGVLLLGSSHLLASAFLGFCHLRYWFFLYPVLCVLAVLPWLGPQGWLAPWRVSRSPWGISSFVGSLLVLCLVWPLFPLGRQLEQAKAYRRGNPFPEVASVVRSRVQQDAVVCTDVAWQTTWFGDVRTVWLPYQASDFSDLEALVPVDLLVLTNLWTPQLVGWNRTWHDLLESPQRAEALLGGSWRSAVIQRGRLRIALFERSS